MKYLIIIVLLLGCGIREIAEEEDRPLEYGETGEEEVRHGGDTTFWKGREYGFLLTQQETQDWVVIRMEKRYDRYSLWKKVGCDIVKWPVKPDSDTCLIYESKISNVRYHLLGDTTREYILLTEYGEKYVYETNE